MSRLFETLERLAATIDSRKGGDPAASYTARLMADPKLAPKKLGEEAVETVIAAVAQGPDELASESAALRRRDGLRWRQKRACRGR